MASDRVPESEAKEPRRTGRSRLLWLAVACGAACALALHLVPEFAGLYVLTLYSIVSNSLLPVPHEPGLLYFAQIYDPLTCALTATFGAGLATLSDYALVRASLRLDRIRRMRESKASRQAIRWFGKRPFATVFVFSLTPLPVYVVRILAPAANYSYPRYLLAIMLGRLPRFYLVALIGNVIQVPWYLLVLIFLVMLASALAVSRAEGPEQL